MKVEAPGFLDLTHHLVQQGGREDVIRLERACSVSGIVVDSSGRPLPNVPLKIGRTHDRLKKRVETDSSGRFHFARAERDEIEIQVDRESLWCVPTYAYAPERGVQVVAYRSTYVEGQIVRQGADPGRDAPAGFVRVEGTDCTRHVQGGVFDMRVPPGQIVLLYEEVGGATCRTELHVREGETRTGLRIEVPPRPAAPRKTDIEGPWVEIDGTALLDHGVTVWLTAIYRNGNKQRLPDPQALNRVVLHRPDLCAIEVATLACGLHVQPARAWERVQLAWPRCGKLKLRLRDQRAHWVDQGRIGVRPARTRGWPSPRVHADRRNDPDSEAGAFTVSGVGPGSYDLLWVRESPRKSILLLQDVHGPEAGETIDLGTVVLPRPLALEVHVIDERGRPVPDAVVGIATGSPGVRRRADGAGIARFEVTDPIRLDLAGWDAGTRWGSRVVPVGDGPFPYRLTLKIQ